MLGRGRLSCSEAFAQIILKCTRFEESQRYANFEEIVCALNELSKWACLLRPFEVVLAIEIDVVDAGDAWECTK